MYDVIIKYNIKEEDFLKKFLLNFKMIKRMKKERKKVKKIVDVFYFILIEELKMK